jgi:hypothetical protein
MYQQGGFMSRKRTTDQSTTDTDTQATPTTTIVTEGATLEAVSPEAKEQTTSFVARIERERQKGKGNDPFGIAGDYAVGVRLIEDRQDRLMVLKFDEKPSQAVIDRLKDAGFRWNPRDKAWVYPIRPDFARTIRVEAERLYQEVRGMIRQEKGIEAGQEIPF